MNAKIKNRDALLSQGDIGSKQILLDIAEATLWKLDAYERIKSIVSLSGDILTIGSCSWDLSKKKHIYLFGAGKACNHMARAIDEILRDKLTKGIIIVKLLEPEDHFYKTDVYVGGHPLPNETGMLACQKMLEIVEQASSDDLFIAVISGGSSALMSLPIDGISLQDEIDATDVLLKSGAGIYEINAVRRHISQMNGGMLAKKIADRGAELIGFGISDAVGTPATGDIGIPYANYKGTPIGPDQTTIETAREVIKNYDLAQRLPRSVVEHITNCGPEYETPKAFPQNTYFLLNTLPDSCIYAKQIAEDMGLPVIIFSSFLEGESRDAGTFFASLAREIQTYGNPVKPPCVILSSGETTTKITDNAKIKGHGGPSQELTASFALAAQKIPGCAFLSIDSEGTDGTTPAAGGITDSKTLARANEQEISLHAALAGHSCYEALDALDAAIFTGNTGTNLCDFNIMYVPKRSENEN